MPEGKHGMLAGLSIGEAMPQGSFTLLERSEQTWVPFQPRPQSRVLQRTGAV